MDSLWFAANSWRGKKREADKNVTLAVFQGLIFFLKSNHG